MRPRAERRSERSSLFVSDRSEVNVGRSEKSCAKMKGIPAEATFLRDFLRHVTSINRTPFVRGIRRLSSVRASCGGEGRPTLWRSGERGDVREKDVASAIYLALLLGLCFFSPFSEIGPKIHSRGLGMVNKPRSWRSFLTTPGVVLVFQ
jgi:hypothetical protein